MSGEQQLSIPVWLTQDAGGFYIAAFEPGTGVDQLRVQAPLPEDERRTVALYRKTVIGLTALEKRRRRFPSLPVHVWTWVDPEWGPVASLRPFTGIRLKRCELKLLSDGEWLTRVRGLAAQRMRELGVTNDWVDPMKLARVPQEAKPERVSIRTVSGGLPTLGRGRR